MLPFSRSQDRAPPPKRGAGGWPHGGGAKSPRPPGENRMKDEEVQLAAVMLEVAEGNKILARARLDQARERAAARCMLRDDVLSVELREDGTILCTGYNGDVTLRLGGWRGRS